MKLGFVSAILPELGLAEVLQFAAAQRFREATRWNAGLADAWLRLGDAEEKLKETKAAREAYAKYLELSPDAKNATEIRNKINKK